MSQDYIVLFEKTKEYHRFHATGIFTNFNKNMFSIDLFEESSPIMQKFIVDSAGTSRSEYAEDSDLVNYVHATMVISPENLPNIIDSLQNLYERYRQSKEPKTGE